MEVAKLKSSDRQALRRAAHQQCQFISRRLYEAALAELDEKAAECGLHAALQPDAIEAAIERAVRRVADGLGSL